MPRLSFIYDNFARIDGHMLAIPRVSPDEYLDLMLNDRVLSRLGAAAREVAIKYNSDSPPTIFTAQLVGRHKDFIIERIGTNVSGIITNELDVVGAAREYWYCILARGLKPVINTTIEPWPAIVAEESPDFALLGIQFPHT